MTPALSVPAQQVAVCNFHSAIAGFLKTHPIEDLLPHLVEAIGSGRFYDLRYEVENFNWQNRAPGKVYCWRCGKEQTSEELHTTKEGRAYGSTTAFETIVVGYTCDECGHTEDL